MRFPSNRTPTASATGVDAVRLLEIDLRIGQNDSVAEGQVSLGTGRATPASILDYQQGTYRMEVSDADGIDLWSQPFGLCFAYNGPVLGNEDYSVVNYSAMSVSY